MKRVMNVAGSVLGIVALVVLAAALLLTFGGPGERQVAQEPGGVNTSAVSSPPSLATSTAVPYPPPPPPTVEPPATPTPEPYPPPPTMTPVPTATQPPSPTVPPWPPTPEPTATRRPGLTVTPFPTRGPAPDAAGTILYALAPQRVIMGLPVDGQGQKVVEAAPLPLALDFTPILGPPAPDGRYLLLLQSVEPGGIPYVLDLRTQQLWPVFQGYPRDIIGWPFGWHPDSRQVLFWEHDFGLWLANVETGEFTIMALIDGPVQGVAISPDGQEVIYIAGIVRGAMWHEAMWKASSAGSDARLLFEMAEPSYVFGWSPDGSQILYAGRAAVDPPVPARLWLMDPEGQNRRPLSGPYLFGWTLKPVWSPSGGWIVFTGLDEGQAYGCFRKEKNEPGPDPATCRFEGTAIYIENVRTGEVRRLASGVDPVWSPDGKMLAFLSNQSGAVEIWRVRMDGTDLQQLTSDAQPKWQFFWTAALDRR